MSHQPNYNKFLWTQNMKARWPGHSGQNNTRTPKTITIYAMTRTNGCEAH